MCARGLDEPVCPLQADSQRANRPSSHCRVSAGRPGKTLLAKAVANQTSATFLRVVGSELIQKYLGDGPKLVRELFRVAEENAPSIVFIDEIDAVGTKRCDASHPRPVDGSAGGGGGGGAGSSSSQRGLQKYNKKKVKRRTGQVRFHVRRRARDSAHDAGAPEPAGRLRQSRRREGAAHGANAKRPIAALGPRPAKAPSFLPCLLRAGWVWTHRSSWPRTASTRWTRR